MGYWEEKVVQLQTCFAYALHTLHTTWFSHAEALAYLWTIRAVGRDVTLHVLSSNSSLSSSCWSSLTRKIPLPWGVGVRMCR